MIDLTEQDLALLPLKRLNGALKIAMDEVVATKEEAVLKLGRLIAQGLITLQDVKNAPVITAPAPSVDSWDAIWERLSELAGVVKDLNQTSDAHTDSIESVNISMSQIAQASKEPVDISRHVQAEVSRMFDSFKEVTPVERMKKVAADLPVFTLMTAGSVFPDCVYVDEDKTVDFSSMEVAVWNDPQAPLLVEDYVFKPEHLHQALVALDDPVPDNVWLAGERGTGKTEFVTQIASRLGRRLFRVNFDEALERADFIGANTIENGSVVWKAGIIAQAIQHPGSIVLLDEVGFARAQSIAVLHSLTERSANRALVVNETGEKIRVAQYVSFFACDNSNGHGDESGNFAGVRDQNTAFLDRFGFTLEFQYLPVDAEAKLIASRTGLSALRSKALVNFASVAREAARGGTLTQPPSLRQLFALARAVKKGIPIRVAFQSTIVNKYPSECAPELIGAFNATIVPQNFL